MDNIKKLSDGTYLIPIGANIIICTLQMMGQYYLIKLMMFITTNTLTHAKAYLRFMKKLQVFLINFQEVGGLKISLMISTSFLT